MASSYCHGHLPPKVVGGAGIGGNRRGGRARCSSSGRLHAAGRKVDPLRGRRPPGKKARQLNYLGSRGGLGGRRIEYEVHCKWRIDLHVTYSKLQPNIFQVTCLHKSDSFNHSRSKLQENSSMRKRCLYCDNLIPCYVQFASSLGSHFHKRSIHNHTRHRKFRRAASDAGGRSTACLLERALPQPLP